MEAKQNKIGIKELTEQKGKQSRIEAEKISPDSDTGTDSSTTRREQLTKRLFSLGFDDSLGGKTLLVYKIFYFFFYGAFAIVIAYLPLYFKQLGLLASHVGLLTGARPLLQTVGAPFWGMLADKLKVRKTILLAALVAFTLKTLLFMAFRPTHQTCEVTYTNQSHKITTLSPIRHNVDKFTRGFHLFPMTGALNAADDLCPNNSPTKQSEENGMCPAVGRDENLEQNEDGAGIREKREARGGVLKRKKSRNLNGKTIIETHENFTVTYTRYNEKAEMQHLFIVFLMMILVGEFLESPTMTLTDASCLDVLKEKRHFYGRIRLWGSLGHGVTVPIVGLFIHGFRQIICGDTYGNYYILFLFFAIFAIFAFITATNFEFSYEEHEPTWRSAMFLMRFRYAIFLLVAFYLGCCHGFLINFINWYIEDLGATTLIMGIAGGLRSITDVLVFSSAGYVITTMGYANVLNCTLVTYTLCFMGYAYMEDPWFALPIEVLQAASYAATWSACVSFIAASTPVESPATIQGILQGVYWGLGTGTGAIIGGFLVHHVGGDITFRVFALSTATVFSLFILVQLVLRYAGRDALDYHKIPTEPPTQDEQDELLTEASEEDELD